MTEEKIRDAFAKKLISDFKDCLDEWSGATPSALIDNADVISVTQRVRNTAEEVASVTDMKYFLRFKHPLIVMRDLELENMTAYPLSGDEVKDMVSVMRERRDMETNYEMDENYIPAENGCDISGERASYLLGRAMCYIGKFDRELDLYDTLHEIIGMSDAEIEEMGFDNLARYYQDEPDDAPTLSM